MKKIFAVILTVVMMATLFVGCNGSDSSSSKTKKVAIIQQVENGAFNDMRAGIIKGLKAKGYISSDKDVDYQCADGDETNLNTITQSVANGDYDAVFTVATPVLSELQVTALSNAVEGVAVAESVTVPPTFNVSLDGSTEIAVTRIGLQTA